MSVVRIAICRNAARMPRDERVEEDRVRRLRERIMERSVGLFATPQDRQSFLKSLSEIERKRWVEILTERRLAHVLEPDRVGSIHQHETLETLKREWGSIADVLVCSHEHAERLQLDAAAAEPAPAPEVTPLARLDLVKAFSDDPENVRQRQRIAAGEEREQVWSDHIAPLVPWVKHLLIVDRYVLQNANRPTEGESELRWFLERVRRERTVASKLKLEIVTEQLPGKPPSPTQLAHAIRTLGLQAPASLELGGVTLWLADKEFAQQHLHERVLRFDGRALDFGNGLVVFSKPKVFQSTKVALGRYEDSEETLQLVGRHCSCARWRADAELWLSEPDQQALWPDEEEV
ncbi:MAG TPA: hypothetical protein VK756_01365 [Solirubrobacteraceae bacterium]|jgi:hypothetical protein|nr:hypothetical protein [Solirubrobacteraceae bacterium]